MTPDPALASPPGTAPATACRLTDGCITCGDVAVVLTVVAVVGEADARCRDAAGRVETVAVELVGAVRTGDRLLVHAGVALERLVGQVEG